LCGTLFDTHVAPESVEVKIEPSPAATSLVPSGDEATQLQPKLVGALVGVQVWASAKLAVSKAVEVSSRILKRFIGRPNEPLAFNHFIGSLSSQQISYETPIAFVSAPADLIMGGMPCRRP
jgi:hypothetical protein